MTAIFPTVRLRRLRQHPVLRSLISETNLNVNDLVFPLFLKGKTGKPHPIGSMPGHYQLPLENLEKEIEELLRLNLSSIILFGIPSHKDPIGSASYHSEGIIQEAIGKIKKLAPDLLIITDLCMCEYTDHGHCGIIKERRGRHDIDNDETLGLLAKQAISHADAGADLIAPSGMIDGMVRTIRHALDSAGHCHIPILSYSVKYQSSLYSPFREAAEGAPTFGDRSTHQLDPANALEALREVEHDVAEGADMLMVKPAHTYLDIIQRVKVAYPHIPLCAYHTSGEFAMIKAAAKMGWIDEQKVAMETLRSIKRAGADFIITYFAKEFAEWSLDGMCRHQ